MSFQQLIITGNVGNDADIKFSENGQAIVSFNVAVNKTTGKGDKRKQTTTWFGVTVWGEYGEALVKYITKGSLISVTGEVSTSAWTDQTGKLRAGMQIKAADRVVLLGGNHKTDQNGEYSQPTNGERHAEAGTEPTYTDAEDIPF